MEQGSYNVPVKESTYTATLIASFPHESTDACTKSEVLVQSSQSTIQRSARTILVFKSNTTNSFLSSFFSKTFSCFC